MSFELNNYDQYEVTVELSGLATALYRSSDSRLANKLNNLDSILKTITVTDDDSKVRFKGEVRRPRLQRNVIQFEARGYEQKLNRTICETQSVVNELIVRSLVLQNLNAVGSYLYDDQLSLSVDTYAGYIATFKKTDPKVLTIDPSHTFDYVQMHAGTGVTPDNTAGAIGNLYFNNGAYSEDNNRLSADKSDTVALELSYEIPALATSSEINKLELEAIIVCRRPPITLLEAQLPEIFIYDWIDSEYNAADDLVYAVTRDDIVNSKTDDTFGYNQSEPIYINQQVVINSNYFDENLYVGSGLYEIYRSQIAFESTKYATLSDAIHVIKSLLTITYDSDQTPEQGRFYINNNTATRLDFDVAQTWESKCPRIDGYGVGDTVFISKNISAYLTDVFNDSDITLTLDQNVTELDTYGMTKEWRYEYIIDLLEYIVDNFNAIWWVDYATNTLYLRSEDNVSSSGITITSADIIGYEDETFSQIYDADMIYNKILVVGDNVVYSHTISSTEYAHTLGSETLKIKDTSIKNEVQAKQKAEELEKRYSNAKRGMSFTVNVSKTTDYSALTIGSTVAIKLPTASDTTVADYSTTGDGELLITKTVLKRDETTGNQDHLTVTVRKIRQ